MRKVSYYHAMDVREALIVLRLRNIMLRVDPVTVAAATVCEAAMALAAEPF
jgi:hypothetical protein